MATIARKRVILSKLFSRVEVGMGVSGESGD